MNEDILKLLGLERELNRIKFGLCPICGKKVWKFRDKLSEREFEISGMCQICQDEIFREEKIR